MSKSFIDPPQLKNFRALVDERGCFYCIPEYQRSFSWKKSNIKRLFGDAAGGLRQLIDGEDSNEISRSVRFLGAFVCFEGDKHSSIVPGRGENPNRILSIIDGQQRLTAFTLLCAEMHNQLRVQLSKKIGDGWLRDQIESNVQNLEHALGESKKHGGRFYPRTIREGEDKWAEKEEDKNYDSDLSAFLDSYYAFLYADNKKLYSKRPFKQHKFNDKSFRGAMKCIKDELNAIKGERSEYADMPSLEELFNPNAANSPAVMDALFGSEPDKDEEKGYILWEISGDDSSEDKRITLNSLGDDEQKNLRQVLLLLFIARYVYEKMLFIQIIVQGYRGYAFDIFDSLNTTGMILTAFETFRPEVIRRLEQIASESSSASDSDSVSRHDSKDYLDEIGEFLGSDTATRAKTQNLITSFALAENGEKLPSRFEDQRVYLRGQYNKLSNDGAEKFVKRLLDTARIHQHFWSNTVQLDKILPSTSKTRGYLDEASFCLHYLSSAKHDIVRALIARFYSFYELDKAGTSGADDVTEAKVVDFCEAIKATAAFYTLWRAMRTSTDDIDSLHRKIMSGMSNIDILPGYCYTKQAGISSKNLKQIYREFLSNEQQEIHSKDIISGKKDWINQSWSIEIYDTRSLAKFMLMIAHHRTVQHSESSKYLKRVLPGADATETVSKYSWKEPQYESIEHICPQNPTGRDKDRLSSQITDRLGNLTLLPQMENVTLSNKPWPQKKLIFTVFAAEDEETSEAAIEGAIDELAKSKEFDDDQLNTLREKISAERCLPLPKTLTHYNEFGEDEIRERGKHLLGLAWDILAVEWLGWDKEVS